MTDFQPAFKFNLLEGTPVAFRGFIEKFEEWKKTQPVAPFTLTTGWATITQQDAEELLKRNLKNRSVNFQSVYAYAVEMANGQWRKTGQPIVFTDRQNLLDGQHRLWACYLTGRTIESFAVTDVPHDDMLFAFVDNMRPRSGADALQTAGLNGLASHLSAVINTFAHRHDMGVLSFRGRMPGMKLQPHEIIQYVNEHPLLLQSAKHFKANHAGANRVLGARIVTFLGWKIAERFGMSEADDFMSSVVNPGLPEGHPVIALRTKVEPIPAPKSSRGKLKPVRLPEIEILAYCIKAFNATRLGQSVKKLDIDLGEAFPELAEPDHRIDEAAE